MRWRDLSECGAQSLADGMPRLCVRVTGHEGLHQDLSGQAWETEQETLTRLRGRWGHRWHIVFTGRSWIATTYRLPGEHPRVESAPSPDQLEELLDRAPAPGVPLVPAQRGRL